MSSIGLSLGGFAANNVNLFRAISDTDLMGLACLVACVILSIGSWAIILFKYQQLERCERASKILIKKSKESNSLEHFFQNAQRLSNSPKSQIFIVGYTIMKEENWFVDKIYSEEGRLRASHLTLERMIETSIIEQVRMLESRLMFLATTCNVAPFIGLFGTVWGVLGAFQALSSSAGAANIQNLAPGMATALVAVIMGLTAAIPASVAYNYFTNRIGVITAEMDSFALQTIDALQKEVLLRAANLRNTGAIPTQNAEEFYLQQQYQQQQQQQQYQQQQQQQYQQQHAQGGQMFD